MAGKEEIIEQLADKYHVSEDEVRKAVNSQFKFTASKIRSGEFPSIRLPYFGIFRAKENRIKQLQSNNKDDNE